MPGEAVSPGIRREVAVRALRHQIIIGELAPGSRLTESALTQVLAVSRATLREAVQQLVHEGLVSRDPYKGIRVVSPSPRSVREVAQVRFALELIGALALSDSRDEADLACMRDALARMHAAHAQGDYVERHYAHLDFHHAMWAGAHNEALEHVWPQIAAQISVPLVMIQTRSGRDRLDFASHERLLGAIELGTRYDVQHELHAHIIGSADDLAEHLTDHVAPGVGAAGAGLAGGPVAHG